VRSVSSLASLGLAGWISAAMPVVAGAQSQEIPAREAAAKADPKDPAAQAALGTAYLRAGRYPDAKKQFERAEALTPLDPMAVTRRAEVAIAQGDYKQAKSQCKRLYAEAREAAAGAGSAAKKPKPKFETPPLAHVCMARAHLAWNRSEPAFEELALALAQEPTLGEAQLVLGHAHRIRNQMSEAEAAYLKAKQNPQLIAEADLGLGRLYVTLGKKAEATASLREALARDGQWPELQYELGSLLGATPEALELLSQASAGKPGWADAARGLGDAARQAGELERAEAAYRQALKSDPNSALAHLGLGEALGAKGQLGDAEAALRKAISLVSNDARAVLALAEVQLKQGQFEEALDSFRHAADLDPKNPAGLIRAAEASLEHRRATLAAGFLDRLLANYPTQPKALVLYGDVMRARGDKAAAKQFYDRAVSAGGQVDASRLQLK
jgi:tetratricopeptide (TPR) repeat protein